MRRTGAAALRRPLATDDTVTERRNRHGRLSEEKKREEGEFSGKGIVELRELLGLLSTTTTTRACMELRAVYEMITAANEEGEWKGERGQV